jgi:uncharacterized protein YsxB (DUF464 family)
MIKITFSINADEISVNAEGHALFDAEGKDVVCASVSTLLQSWYFSEKELCQASVEAEMKKGFFKSKMRKHGEKEDLLFQSLVLNLAILEKQFPDHIKVNLEEKDGRQQHW